MSTNSTDRRIKFLSRDLPFPTDPTFREYRVVNEVTGITADEIMTGKAGIWMLPILAMIALMRANKNVEHEQLTKLLDLRPQDIEVTGIQDDEDESENENDPLDATLTGTESTDVIPEQSGTPDSPTSSPELQDTPTT